MTATKTKSDMQIIPVGSRMLVEKHEKKAQTKSGFVLSGTEASITHSGVVKACGREVQEAKEGDVVLFTEHAGLVLEYLDERYFFLREAEIVTLIRENT